METIYCRLVTPNMMVFGYDRNPQKLIYVTGHSNCPLNNLGVKISELLLQNAMEQKLYLGVDEVMKVEDGQIRRLTKRQLREHIENALRSEFAVKWINK